MWIDAALLALEAYGDCEHTAFAWDHTRYIARGEGGDAFEIFERDDPTWAIKEAAGDVRYVGRIWDGGMTVDLFYSEEEANSLIIPDFVHVQGVGEMTHSEAISRAAKLTLAEIDERSRQAKRR